jgi:sensor histidine kinase regulating citrate/malate metabolism
MKTLNLLELTKRAIQRFKRDEFQFVPVFDEDSFEIKNKTIEPLIRFNEEDFFTIFHNTIENFIQHGFKDRTNNLVLLVIEFDQDTSTVNLDISNNGHPFMSGFSSDRLKIRGESTKNNLENGIVGNGGADIHELIKMNGAKFDVDLDENREFPVTYTFEFSLYQEELI